MTAAVQPLRAATERPDSTGDADTSALDAIGSLARETLGERVTGELRALLVAGRLAPGEKLSLRRVAEALGVSMMPVREAVSRLAADGALEVLPGRAVRVPVLSLAQFRELTRLRLVVEGFAAEEAARQATPADIERIEAFDAAFRQAASADPPDSAAAVAANRDLHFALYEAAAMPSLIEMIERLWLKAGPILNLDMRHEPRRLEGGSAMQAHARLLEAVRRRNAPAARAALEDDIAAAAAHIAETGQLRA
ncbi:MAG TPA: GntR family transcriptional regulator [Bosea sp. (in: a-proteobacteria)]|jgi:DNA-binding GntR family transcriptional regulator|uniref:GntR family transcriptional regulator n=1 Tax=Bosea sp. (in: a-proteobacteria) TaxID=1871050 RepID=UPI002DDCA0F3|nr:GntR family transcriptional regulator [Bosea sp. (in: a-proteobacteria)]HEV2554187.1 GntR family transcriptional regulator [Bosea sp. (in: a-proteobacteria)]